MTDLKKLADFFPPSDVEWRIGQSGKKGDVVWAKALAYITNRAIMQRLDDVCGPGGWKNEFQLLGPDTILCGISILVEGQWVTKWDGMGGMDATAGLSEQDAAKGTLSGAMKRAGYQWGIGRYLYDLPEGWVTTSHEKQQGWNYAPAHDKKGIPAFYWKAPDLPKWALPQPKDPESVSPHANGQPPKAEVPVMPDLSRLSILHTPAGDKNWWRVEGDTSDHEPFLKRLGFSRKKSGAKEWYTGNEQIMESLARALPKPPEPLSDFPRALQPTEGDKALDSLLDGAAK